MPSTEQKLRVLVRHSAAEKDVALAGELLQHLDPLRRFAGVDVWSEARIRPGDDWREAIPRAIDQADVALVLLSADFLATDGLMDVEVPRLLERHRTGALRVIPVVLRSCLWEVHPWLKDLHPLPKGGKAIGSFSADARDEVLTELAKEIVSLVSASQDDAGPTDSPAGVVASKENVDRAPRGDSEHSNAGRKTRREGQNDEASAIDSRLRAAVLLREYDRAEALAQQLVDLVDTDEAWRASADIACRMGKYDVALRRVREAVQRVPARLETWLFGFRAAMATHDYREARRWLEATVQLAPRHPEVLKARAHLAFEDGEMGTLQAALRDLHDDHVLCTPRGRGRPPAALQRQRRGGGRPGERPRRHLRWTRDPHVPPRLEGAEEHADKANHHAALAADH